MATFCRLFENLGFFLFQHLVALVATEADYLNLSQCAFKSSAAAFHTF